jgi:uncharacterized repeat protein (TIGR03803 family)
VLRVRGKRVATISERIFSNVSVDRKKNYGVLKKLSALVDILLRRLRGPGVRIERLEPRILFSTFTTIAPFTGANGNTPMAGLVEDGSGNLYGTTSTGGAHNNGEIFEIASGSSTITVLASFNGQGAGTNGDDPVAGLAIDSSGNLFGVAEKGGANGDGTIVELVKGSSTLTTLYSFTGGTDGQDPVGGLIVDTSGNLYGTTFAGGANNVGAVFELPKGAGTVTTLASFNSTDGDEPEADLVRDSSGNLYGTTAQGGSPKGDGTIFEVVKGSGTITVLYNFNGSTDGKTPVSDLLMDGSGNLFGTTSAAGANGEGTIFELPKGGSAVTTLASFSGLKAPMGGVTEDSAGNFFGTAQSGGSGGFGGVWELANGASTITAVYNFTNGTDGANPNGDLLLDGSGNLYGTASSAGSSNDGTVYKIAGATSVPTKLAFSQQPTTVTAGSTISPAVTVKVEDQNGNVIAGNTSSVTLSIASGPGTLGGTVTVAAVNGIATFNNLSITTAGSYTIKASDGSLTTATSSSFTVNPAAASKLAYQVQPSNVTSGSNITPAVTVDIEDQYGNVVTSNTSNVTLAVASGPGTLGGTTTVAAVNGVAIFNSLSIATVGTYTIKATDGALTSATSSSFTVSAAAASKLAFAQQPTNVTAGSTISPSVTVQIEDASGNVVTGNTSSVTLSIASGPGTLGGTLTVAAVAGVATFNNLSITTAGAYTIKAADGSLTTATSSSFTVSAAAASKLAFAQQPTNAAAGATISPAVTVDVEDQYGNIVTGNTSNVTLSLASGPGTLGGTLTVAAVAGVATFSNLSITTAGAYTIKAADGALTTATSSSFTISAAAASKLAFAQQPTNVTSGGTITPAVTVDIEDQYGNIVTGNTSSVTLSVASGPGTLAGTLTVAAVAGVATFNNLSIATVGSYTLKAADGALTTATSSSFTVSAAAASKLAFAQQPTNVTAGSTISPSVTVQIEDASGNVVTSNTSSVTLSIASGPGTLGGTLTVAAVAGVATFNNLSITTAGSYTIKAADGALTTATSSSFSVSAAAANKLAFAQQPTNATAGATISPSVTVDVEDQYGNIVTGNTSNVTLSIASGPGTLGGTLTVAAVAGVATFNNLSITTVGSYTIKAADGALTTATSSSFTISAAAASKLAFAQQPTNVTAGATISPAVTVDVEDQYGNIVTGNTSNVTLSVASGPGTLGGTVTVAAVAGVATFNSLSITTAGAYTIKAADSALTTATSSSFTISAAAASKLAFIQQPTNATAGATISPAVTVAVEDQYGNVVTSSTASVILGIAGSGTLWGTTVVSAVNGVATFSNINEHLTGTFQLQASTSGLTVGTSSSFTISPAAAATLVIAQQPTNATAGATISPAVTVDIEDSFGNIVTTNTSNVTLSVATGPGTLGGTVTVAAVAGVATFSNLSITTAGSYTINAADGALTGATSSSFTISAAAAIKLAFAQQPTNVTAGATISPAVTVDVEDQFGNIVTGNTSNVTLSIASGPGTLGGTLTVAAVAGVATFNNLSITTAGAYTIKAADGALTTATSGSFTVSSAAASKLAFVQQPTNATAGATISPAATVDVEDQYGNIVTGNTSNVTLSVASGPGTLGGTLTVAAVAGVATFNNLSLNTAGTYTINAADGALTGATSSSFTISAAAASKLAFAQQPTNVTAGATISPAVTVDIEDQFGNIVTSNTSSVTMSIASGPGTLGGTLTIAAVAGVATFNNLSITTAGAYTIKAADGALTTATSGSFTVSPAAASKLVFAQQPTNATAGAAITPAVTVDVEDQYGNIVTGNTSNVTMSIASGPGSLGGTLTVAAVAGVATFNNLSIDTAGSYTIKAADGALTTATSGSFTVSAAAASKLAFVQQPTNVTAGSAISPAVTVSIEDQFGNVVTGNTSNVTMAVASGPGALGGTVTVAAVAGVATFSNLSITTAGSYTISATDGALSSATSGSFTVSAAAASKLAFVQQPTNVQPGAAISPAPTVAIEDQYGNVVTSNTSSVTMAVASGPGSLGGTLTVAAVSGIATFSNLTLATSGSYTLKGTDGALTGATSAGFTVGTATASKLAFVQQPTNVAAGAAISPAVTVAIEDQFGNVVTGNASSVTVALASGPGTLGGTVTVAAVNGVATFSNLTLDTAGTDTLSASDGALTSATSGSFTVTPAAASKLVFAQQPTNVAAGSAISPAVTVSVEDQFGNVVTGNTSNVTLAVATGPGTLGGTVTVAAVNGVATFNNLSLITAGNYTLNATDGALTSAASGSFTVTPAAASKLAFAQQPTNVAAGSAISPAVTVDVEDQFGNIVTGNSSSVMLSVATGPGTLGGTVTVAAVNGVATFSNLSLTTAGSYTLNAADGALTSATSGSFTVSPAAANKLAFAQQPTNATAGSAISPAVTVDVEDQFGNIVAGNTSNVTLSVASGPGTLGGTVTVAAVNGVATFSNLSINTAGSYTIKATDGALTSATSSSFTVSPAAASKLVFAQQPTNVTAGSAISPAVTVDVEDQFGNIVTGNTSSVTMAVASGPGSLGGTLTVAAVAGVATFSNLSLTTAGSYTIKATDGALTSATSGSFTVSPAAASKLAIAQQPTNVAAGSAISPAVTIDVEDQFGNIVTGNTSNVTMSIASGPGSLGGTVTVAAVNGVATFSNLSINATGAYTIKASDGALTTATSGSFNVTPAAANKLVFVQQPTNATAGVAISPAITVNVEDQFGNLVTGNTSNVTISVASGPSSALSGTLTVAAVGGVATFSNISEATAGAFTFSAADGALATATSASFTISPATAAKLGFIQQPTNVNPGVSISPAVTVGIEDAFGNVITSNTSSVTISLASGPGTLSGTLTASAVNGVATFNNLSLSTTGSYSLKAVDGSFTSATSAGFTVGTATAAGLQFVQQPTNVAAGSAINPAVTVEVVDQFGNLVTANTSNVTIALASGPGNLAGTLTVAASGGIATFSNLSINATGVHTLSASDGSLTGATSGSFTVTAAASAKLVYTQQPTNIVAGNTISPAVIVQIEDQFGNLETGDTSSVTLSIASGPGTLGGTTTVAAVGGVATFSNLSLNTTGTYTLAALDGSLSGATSGSFSVTPAAAAKLVFVQQPTNANAGAAMSPAVTVNVEDQFGNIVTGNTSNVTLSVASGPGALGGTDTASAVNGVATFSNLSLDTAGSYTLQAADGSLTIATSSAFNISPAAASQLVFVQQPPSATAGNSIAPAVAINIEDAFGNIVTSDSSNVTISVASGPGSLNGTLTLAAVSGVATFSDLSLNTAGSYTLEAADGSLGTAVSNGFTVTPAAAASLVFVQQPTDVAAGNAISPAVTVIIEDAFGNVVTGNSSNVTMSVASGPGTLSGTVTVAAVNGTATFGNLMLSTAGNYTLSAADGSLAGATSGSFNVTPAAAAKLVFVQQPTNVAPGSAISPAVTVDVLDSLGNLVTSDNSNVTISLASGPGSLGGTLTVAAVNGVATFNDLTLSADGSYVLTATDGSLTPANSVSFAVSSVTVSANPNPVTGTTVDLSVVGATGGGSTIYTWLTTAAPAGAVLQYSTNGTNTSNDTTVTFNEAGVYTFVNQLSDSGGTTQTSSVTVTVEQTLTTVSVTPAGGTIYQGQSKQFTATAFDQFGNAMSVQPTFNWSVSSGAGSVDSTGLYTAPDSATTAVVTAQAGSLSDFSGVSVLAIPAPQGLNFTPSFQQVVLSWSYPPDVGQSGFAIQRSLDNATFTTIGTVGAGTTAYTDATISPGNTYFYRIVATAGSDVSDPSNVVMAAIPSHAIAGPGTDGNSAGTVHSGGGSTISGTILDGPGQSGTTDTTGGGSSGNSGQSSNSGGTSLDPDSDNDGGSGSSGKSSGGGAQQAAGNADNGTKSGANSHNDQNGAKQNSSKTDDGSASGRAAVAASNGRQDLLVAGRLVAVRSVAVAEADFKALNDLENSPQVLQEENDALVRVGQEQKQQRMVFRVASCVTATAVAGYIVWLVQGGTLLMGVISALPFWRWLDPLPVLDSWEKTPARGGWFRRRRKSREPEERELEGIVD